MAPRSKLLGLALGNYMRLFQPRVYQISRDRACKNSDGCVLATKHSLQDVFVDLQLRVVANNLAGWDMSKYMALFRLRFLLLSKEQDPFNGLTLPLS